jgi:hypothetical protein
MAKRLCPKNIVGGVSDADFVLNDNRLCDGKASSASETPPTVDFLGKAWLNTLWPEGRPNLLLVCVYTICYIDATLLAVAFVL